MYEHMQPGKKRDAKERGKKEKRNTRIYIYTSREKERKRAEQSGIYQRARMRLKCTRLISSPYPFPHKITKRVINQISLYFDVIRSNFN